LDTDGNIQDTPRTKLNLKLFFCSQFISDFKLLDFWHRNLNSGLLKTQ